MYFFMFLGQKIPQSQKPTNLRIQIWDELEPTEGRIGSFHKYGTCHSAKSAAPAVHAFEFLGPELRRNEAQTPKPPS